MVQFDQHVLVIWKYDEIDHFSDDVKIFHIDQLNHV